MEGNTTLKPKQKKRILETVPYISIGEFSRYIHRVDGRVYSQITLEQPELPFGFIVKELGDGTIAISADHRYNGVPLLKSQAVFVKLGFSKIHFGYRKWFCCPKCGVKTGKLYLHSSWFLLCRDCSDLTYASNLKKRPRRKRT